MPMNQDRVDHVTTEVEALRRRMANYVPVVARLSDGSIMHDLWGDHPITTDDIEQYKADVEVYYGAKVVEFEIGRKHAR